MQIRNVILGAIAVLLLTSFIPDIIGNFNTAENTTGAATGLSTGFNIAQISLGIAVALIVLDMAGVKVLGGLTTGRRRR